MTDLQSQVATLIAKADAKATEISHGRWNSSRLWVVAIVAVVVTFATRLLLTDSKLEIISFLAVNYLWANTASKIAFGAINAWLKNRRPSVPPSV